MNTLIHPFSFWLWGAIRSQGAVAISLVALWFLVRITLLYLGVSETERLWPLVGNTSVALGLSTQGLVSGATVHADSPRFVSDCFGQVAPTIQDNWRFDINPVYIDYRD